MSQLPESVRISPEEEAQRLWNGAKTAFESSAESLVSLCEALELGIRAVEILAVNGLRPVADRFPATIAMLLESPDPEVSTERDALSAPNSLELLHVVDMLSADGVNCVSRKLHRGWEDRRRSCQRSRDLARETLGVVLEADEREALLRLEAYRNRIFRIPPPVVIRPGEIREAFPALERLYDALA